jgi:uncharacterized caspase-like protein/TolB-like protein
MLCKQSVLFRRAGFTFATFLAAAGIVLASITSAGSSDLTDEARQPPEGVLWVFAVGVSDYRNSMIDLQYADNDAETLAATLKDRGTGIFRDVKTDVLVNEQVTRQSILDGMKSFFSQASPNDTGVIALMGHGVITNGTFYFVPYPADLTNLKTEGLPVSDFEAAVQAVSAKVNHLALMFDTCHAQALNVSVRDLNALQRNERRARGISLATEVANKVPDTFVLGSSTLDESSWEDASYRMPGERKGHGAFTYALLRGLDGEATTYNGPVEVGDLYAYASHTVREITHDKQIPSHGGGGTSFPIARAPEPSEADTERASVLLKQGERERQKGLLPQAEDTLAKAAQLNPKDQVASVLSDEASADIAYRNDPDAERDAVAAAAALLKETNYKGPEDPWAPRPMVIAFLDFSTVGGSPENGGLHDALVARIGQSLQGTKRVQVADRRLIAAVLQEQRLSMTDLSNPATRLKIGQILVSRLIATGDVAAIDKDKYSVDVQMIDTETTEVKVNLSEQLNGLDKIFAVADKTANEIVNHVEQDYPLKGKIVTVDGDQVVVDIGSNAGATTGTRMNVVVEEPIKVNGEVIATKMNRIGSIEITEVQPKASFAKVIDHTVELKAESKVIEAAKPATPS